MSRYDSPLIGRIVNTYAFANVICNFKRHRKLALSHGPFGHLRFGQCIPLQHGTQRYFFVTIYDYPKFAEYWVHLLNDVYPGLLIYR